MRNINVKYVDTARLRVLLRDAGVNPTTMTDHEVRVMYVEKFGETLVIYDERGT